MGTRRFKKNRRYKRKTVRKQKGGYMIVKDSTVYEDSTTVVVSVLFRDEPEESFEFDDDFNRFYDDANTYFSTNENINPIYKSSNIETLLDGLRKICTRYEYYLSLQDFPYVTPGDFLYYEPNSTYRVGHIETVLGIRHNNEPDCLFVSGTHPTPDNTTFKESTMKIDTSKNDNTVHIIRYSGPNANLIRATTAFLSKLFLTNSLIDYSILGTVKKIGSKLLTGTRCIETDLDEILGRVDKTKQKLFSHEKVATVCSGFSILMCELAFRIHELDTDLGRDMPFDAKACLPNDFYSKIKSLAQQTPSNWKILPFYNRDTVYKRRDENAQNILSILDVKLDQYKVNK
jgi:hypothetical protein